MEREFKALQNLGIRGFEVMRPNRVYKESELKDRFIVALERSGVVMHINKPGPTATEINEAQESEEEDSGDDPNLDPNAESFTVAEGQRNLTEYEEGAWRKYLNGDELDGNEEKGAERARIKLGFVPDPDSEGN